MGTSEAGKEEVRKIQTTGEDGGSHMVTLPKELVEKLGSRKGHKVTVHEYGKKLVIEDWQE